MGLNNHLFCGSYFHHFSHDPIGAHLLQANFWKKTSKSPADSFGWKSLGFHPPPQSRPPTQQDIDDGDLAIQGGKREETHGYTDIPPGYSKKLPSLTLLLVLENRMWNMFMSDIAHRSCEQIKGKQHQRDKLKSLKQGWEMSTRWWNDTVLIYHGISTTASGPFPQITKGSCL